MQGGFIGQSPRYGDARGIFSLENVLSSLPRSIASVQFSGTPAASSYNVTLPAVAAGEKLIMALCMPGNSDVTTPPTGWVQLVNDTTGSAGTDRRILVLEKVADGTEGATLTVPIAGVAQVISAITWRIAGSFRRSEAAIAKGTSASPDAPSVSPSWGTKKMLVLAVLGARGSSLSVYPAGYINTQSFFHTSTMAMGAAERTVTASSENPGAFTIGASDTWAAATIAIY